MSPVNLDHERGARLGFPEVVYGPSKPTPVLLDILHECHAAHGNALITKLQPEKASVLSECRVSARDTCRGSCRRQDSRNGDNLFSAAAVLRSQRRPQ
jgi:NCAIR mutase (PurE)-related protein